MALYGDIALSLFSGCLFLTSPDLVLLGCSNKTLHVYDMNIGKCVTVFNDIHARQPHITRQNKVTVY